MIFRNNSVLRAIINDGKDFGSMVMKNYMNMAVFQNCVCNGFSFLFTQWFISGDFSEGLNLFRNSDLVVKKIYSFQLANDVSSKFRNTGNLIPGKRFFFCFVFCFSNGQICH